MERKETERTTFKKADESKEKHSDGQSGREKKLYGGQASKSHFSCPCIPPPVSGYVILPPSDKLCGVGGIYPQLL